MELTAAQAAVVVDEAPRLRVVGEAGSGKTTVLVHRYLDLARTHPPSRLLVVCPDRGAALRFLDAVLPSLGGAFDRLPVTTFADLATDVLARSSRPDSQPRLLGPQGVRALVTRLLASDPAAAWPRHGRHLGRPAFAAAVASELQGARAAGTLSGAPSDWPSELDELAAFHDRYCSALTTAGLLDGPGLLAAAAAATAGAATAGADAELAHVLVDDLGRASVGEKRFLGALLAAGPGTSLAGTDESSGSGGSDTGGSTVIGLGDSFRRPAAASLVVTAHPSSEGEAVAAELTAAYRDGVRWGEMAVLLRHPRRRAASIARALARHGIPARVPASSAASEPLAASTLDLLRWAGGDEGAVVRLLASPLAGLAPAAVLAIRREADTASLAHHPCLASLREVRDHLRARAAAGDSAADLVYEVWARAIAPRHRAGGRGPAEAPGIESLLGLARWLDRQSGPARAGGALDLDMLAAAADAPVPSSAEAGSDETGSAQAGIAQAGIAEARIEAEIGLDDGSGAVQIASIGAAAGREWHTVVVAGCVEGDLPRTSARASALRPPSAAARRAVLAEEARLFNLATTRATGRLAAVAAPQPGVLVSRYVAAWPRRTPTLLDPPGPNPIRRRPTASPVPLSDEGRLRLSASQLDTYADCPLRHFYEYVLRARGEAGVHADLGSLVHEVLAELCDPGRPAPPAGPEEVLAVASAHWRDDLARWRPQVEEARRDYFAMVTRWWEAEGEPSVTGSAASQRVAAVERRFQVEVAGHALVGSIDRVDVVDEPEGAAVRIVDYKTGKSEPRPGEVDSNLQLAVYHLAASRDPDLAALGPVRTLRLLFVRTMRHHDHEVGDAEAELAEAEARVADAAARMLAEEFEPSVTATCRHCDFHRLCPIQPEGRQVGDA